MVFLKRIDQELTRDRAEAICALLAIVFLAVAVWSIFDYFVLNGADSFTFGFDFAAFWAAARLVVEGNAHLAFDPDVFGPLQRTAHQDEAILLWHYPPTFTALLAPFGKMSAGIALLVFSALSLATWIWATSLIAPLETWRARLPILVCPAAFMCLGGGQNGTFVAALLACFIVGLRDQRKALVILACVALLFKPHFGVLLPVILIALREFRLFLWAAVFGLIFIAASIWITGLPYLDGFLNNLDSVSFATAHPDLIILQASAFAFLVSGGLPETLAISVQVICAIFVIAVTYMVFRIKDLNWDIKSAVFLTGTVLISPYAFQYDLLPVSFAVWLLHRGTKGQQIDGHRTILVLAWAAPLLNGGVAAVADMSILFMPNFALFLLAIFYAFGSRN